MNRGVIALVAGTAALAATSLAGCAASGTHSDALPPHQRVSAPADPSHTVVYRVTGHGTASAIAYLTDGKPAKVTEHNVPLPWIKTLTLAGDERHAVGLVVDFAEIGGVPHDDSITVDGSTLTHGTISGTGSGHSALTGDFGG